MSYSAEMTLAVEDLRRAERRLKHKRRLRFWSFFAPCAMALFAILAFGASIWYSQYPMDSPQNNLVYMYGYAGAVCSLFGVIGFFSAIFYWTDYKFDKEEYAIGEARITIKRISEKEKREYERYLNGEDIGEEIARIQKSPNIYDTHPRGCNPQRHGVPYP